MRIVEHLVIDSGVPYTILRPNFFMENFSVGQAPAWVQKLGSIHKDQVLTKRHGPPPGSAGQPNRSPQAGEAHRLAQPGPPQPEGGCRNEERGPNNLTLLLKWFFLATAAGLIFSTLLGI